MPSDEAPYEAKQQQGEDCIPKTKVPIHPVAADISGDEQSDNTEGQSPVEKAGWKIPDTNGVHIGWGG